MTKQLDYLGENIYIGLDTHLKKTGGLPYWEQRLAGILKKLDGATFIPGIYLFKIIYENEAHKLHRSQAYGIYTHKTKLWQTRKEKNI